MRALVYQAQWDLRGLKVLPDHKGLWGQPVRPAIRARRVHKVLKVPQVPMVRRDPKDHRDQSELPVPQEQRGRRAHKDLPVHKALRVLQALTVLASSSTAYGRPMPPTLPIA